MTRTTVASTAILAAMLVPLLYAAPAQAQFRHTWVASDGDNTANCDRSTPCATFAGAFGKTIAGGEITCVDSGNYGLLNINKSITINCENAIGSNTSTGGGNPTLFSITTAATDVVTLRGLDLDGTGFVSASSVGLINFTGAGVLHVDKVKINHFRGPASGLRFAPNGAARLDVSDSFIADNGSSTATAGILIRPAPGGSANVSINRTQLNNNVNGIFVDGSGGGGAVNVNVRDSVVTGSDNVGIVAASGGAAFTVLVDRTTITSSLNVGVAVSGAAATVQLGNSTISGNVTGVLAVNGGNLRSFKNNQIRLNLNNGTPIAAVDTLD